MPVYSTQTRQMAPSDTPNERAGQIPRQFTFEPSKGVPRFEDLISLRVLERSPTISLPMNTVKDQITTTNWFVRPAVDSPTTAHEEAADEIETFFDGNFNPNNEAFDHLLKRWVNDILSPDAGTLEKVPTTPDSDGNAWLSELWHLDGITMTKQLNEHEEIPSPPDAAYYQFAPRSALPHHTWDDVVESLGHRDVVYSYGRRQHDPISFSRDQVVWVETNPRPETQYGFGLVQQARKWAEILLNVDISNNTYFSENEVPQGVMAIASGSQKEIERNRAYFQDTIKGQTDHIVPIFDAKPEDVGWFPIQGTPEELQFLDSQQWYHKLVWFLFGLNQGEIGDSADVNRSTASEHSRQVFRQTTRPMLDVLERALNVEVLPAMEAYWRVDGELEFGFEIEHEQMEELERRRQSEDLQNKLTTPNAIRQKRGKDEVPWGDVPVEVVDAMARKHPEWAMEQWGGVPEDELPSPGLGDDLDLFGGGGGTTPSADDADGAGDDDDDDETGGDEGNADGGDASHPPADRHDEDPDFPEEFPAIKTLVGDLADEVSRHIEDALSDLEDDVEDAWPDDSPDDDRGLLVDVDAIVDDVQLRDQLLDPVVDANTTAMEAAAEQEAERLEDELEQDYGAPAEVAQIDLSFDVVDTFAWEAMRRRAARNMVSVEDTVKEQVRDVLLEVADEGGDVGDATQALREEVDELSDNHSRLVARTELPQSSREGTQALGEATDVIAGKRWIASNDARSRPWHDAMHEAVVEVDDSWTVPSGWQGEPHYQPSDYPRAAHVVGEDQPFNCRCVQQNVLDEDLPDDLRNLDDVAGVGVDIHLSDLQFDVWREHARDGETMTSLLERVDQNHSRNTEAPGVLGIGKGSYYQWIKEFGVY